ncbi:hypothetical protein C8F01DRAFT_307431 [Mycena amicta]|nr:hypothetical protein C8F01DRAFT_307431 [Mycena amicta]
MGHPRSFPVVLLCLALLLICAPSANGAVSNSTFDDTSSKFTFTGSWTPTSASNPCNFCSSKPDPSQTFNSTWHDGNYRQGASQTTGGSFTFTGSAVYIFGIDQDNTQPDIVFTLGSSSSTHHYTGDERFVYNALFFSATGLDPDATHTVNWIFNINPTSGVGVQAAMFDYAMVTSGSNDIVQPEVTSPNVISSATTTSTTSQSTTESVVTTKGSTSSTAAASDPSDTIPSSPALSASSTSDTPSNALNTSAAGAQSATSSSHHTSIGAIIGGILAALACIVLALIVFLVCRRRQQRQRSQVDAERVAAGLPPLPPQPNMRRIRAGNYTLQPFVEDRPATATVGNVFAASALAPNVPVGVSTSDNTPASDLQPLRRGASVAALASSSSTEPELPPAFGETAAALTRGIH